VPQREPRAPTRSRATKSPTVAAARQGLEPTSRPRVLVVDDRETNRFLLEEALAEIGAEIVVAEGGKRALEIVSAADPEVVILDFQMPGLNGAETARRIKARPGAPFTYVILISAYPEAEEELHRDPSRADRFLGKPFPLDALRAAVGEGLRAVRERRG
jgi:CheY-like chemotaxis protein